MCTRNTGGECSSLRDQRGDNQATQVLQNGAFLGPTQGRSTWMSRKAPPVSRLPLA